MQFFWELPIYCFKFKILFFEKNVSHVPVYYFIVSEKEEKDNLFSELN